MENDQKNQEQIQKKQQQLLTRISFTDDPDSNQPKRYKYSSQTLTPFLYFFKLLAFRPCERVHKNMLELNIPDTIVFNDSDNPTMWFYTNQKGFVTRIDNIQYFQIYNKFCDGAFDKELVAVLKKPTYGYGGPSGNQVKVVSASQIKTVLSLILSNRSQVSVIQKFVKSGSIKPSIVRTCWRASGNNESWTLNSNYQYTSKAKVPQISKFIVNTKQNKGFRAVKNVSQKFTNQTLKYVKNIVDFVSRNLRIKFKQFVCDFIKDEAGNWWFINVKAFILDHDQQKINIKPIVMHDDELQQDQKTKKNIQTYTKCKKCKYCYKIIAEHLMTHKLTLMMILQCDQHLMRLGKNFAWLQRSFKYHVSSVNLYVQHKVCDSCYKLYTQVLKIVHLEQKMGKITGVTSKNDNKNAVSITSVPAFKGQSPQFGSRFPKVKYDADMPENWGLPLQQKIKIALQNQNTKMINICKFMIFIHGLRDIPKHFQNQNHNFYLSYTFLGQTVNYKLDLTKTQQFQEMLKLKLDRMKMMYFFSESRQNIVEFIKKENKLKIQLFQDQQLMGSLQLQLDDFKSDKVIKQDYFKMLSGPKIFPYLSWGLFISLGLHEGHKVNSQSLKLVRKNSILLPELGYHCPDLLPEQWIQMIRDKPDIANIFNQANLENADENQNASLKTNSQVQIKQKLQRQYLEYSKKRAVSHHSSKRRVYY